MGLIVRKVFRRFRANRRQRRNSQQLGVSMLALAIIGLMTSTAVAIPLLNRAVSGVKAIEVSTTGPNSIRIAAEHALWRLAHDPTIHDEMIGDPPTTIYDLVFPGGVATITVVGTEPPPDNGLGVEEAVNPSVVLPNSPTTVDYTITVINDDVVAHDVIRLEADPRVYSPAYIAGSTTGITTDDPIYTGGRWLWNLVTPVSVDPFGGSQTLSWQMTVDESEGNYWTTMSARFQGIGTVDAPLTANIRVVPTGEIDIVNSVTPAIIESGEEGTFTANITVTNTGSDELDIEFIKHFTTRDFDYVSGSTTGATTVDPSRNHDVINNRWEWTWDLNGMDFGPGEAISISFDLDTSGLPPGTHFAESVMRTEQDSGLGQDTTAGTGAASPIWAVRVYDVHVSFEGQTIDIEALLDANGVDPLSWVES